MALKTTYPGSTLIESLVAMVILATLLSIGIMFFEMLWKSGASEGKTLGRRGGAEGVVNRLSGEWAIYDTPVSLIVDTTPSQNKESWFIQRINVLDINGDTLYSHQKILTDDQL